MVNRTGNGTTGHFWGVLSTMEVRRIGMELQESLHPVKGPVGRVADGR